MKKTTKKILKKIGQNTFQDIKGTNHFQKKAKEREFSIKEVREVLSRGKMIKMESGNFRVIYKGIEIIVSSDLNSLITIYQTGETPSRKSLTLGKQYAEIFRKFKERMQEINQERQERQEEHEKAEAISTWTTFDEYMKFYFDADYKKRKLKKSRKKKIN